jgi:hypothetical protein
LRAATAPVAGSDKTGLGKMNGGSTGISMRVGSSPKLRQRGLPRPAATTTTTTTTMQRLSARLGEPFARSDGARRWIRQDWTRKDERRFDGKFVRPLLNAGGIKSEASAAGPSSASSNNNNNNNNNAAPVSPLRAATAPVAGSDKTGLGKMNGGSTGSSCVGNLARSPSSSQCGWDQVRSFGSGAFLGQQQQQQQQAPVAGSDKTGLGKMNGGSTGSSCVGKWGKGAALLLLFAVAARKGLTESGGRRSESNSHSGRDHGYPASAAD